MWDPQRLTTLWAFTAWYRDSFTLLYRDRINNVYLFDVNNINRIWALFILRTFLNNYFEISQSAQHGMALAEATRILPADKCFRCYKFRVV
jgi:hypothetical protein